MAESDDELLSIKAHSDNEEDMLDEFEEAELLKYEEEATNITDSKETIETYDDLQLSLEIPTFEDDFYEEDDTTKSTKKSISDMPKEGSDIPKEPKKAEIVSDQRFQEQSKKVIETHPPKGEKIQNVPTMKTHYNDEEENNEDEEDDDSRRRNRFKSERTTGVVRKHKSDAIPDKLELNQESKEELEKFNKNQKPNKPHNNWNRHNHQHNRNNFNNGLLGQHNNSLLQHPNSFLNLLQHRVYLNNPPRPHLNHPLQNPHHVTYRPNANKELYNMAGAAVNLMMKNSQPIKQNLLQQHSQHNLLQQNLHQNHPLQSFQQKQQHLQPNLPQKPHHLLQPPHIPNIPSQLQAHNMARQSSPHLPIQVRHPVTQQSYRTPETTAIMRARHNFSQPAPNNVMALNPPQQVPIYINQQPPQQNFQPPPLQPFPHLSQQQTLQRSEPMVFQQPQWNQSQQANQQSSVFIPQTSLVASQSFKEQSIYSQPIDNNDFVGQPIQTVILNRSRDSGQNFRGRKKQETFNSPPQQPPSLPHHTPQTTIQQQQQPKAITKEEEEKAKQQMKMLERAKRFAKPPEVKASKHPHVPDSVELSKKAKMEEKEEEEQLMLGRRVVRKSQLAIQADLAQAAFNKTRSSVKDFELQKGLDEQKRLREVVMRRKEERRLMLAKKKMALMTEQEASTSPQKIAITASHQKALTKQINNDKNVENNNNNNNENNKNNNDNIEYGKVTDGTNDDDDVLKDVTSHRTVQFKRTIIANNNNNNNNNNNINNNNNVIKSTSLNTASTPTKKPPLLSKSQQQINKATPTLSINKYNNNNKMVVVANLNHSNNTTQLKKFADLVGPLQSIQFNSNKGKMLLKFQQPNHAWLFCKAFNGKKIGSSIVTATLF